MQHFLQWDLSLFKIINGKFANPFFDAVLPYLRIAELWAPLYLFLILFATTNFKLKGWKWVLLAAATVTITNYISSDLIKGNIFRLRPCNNPAIADIVRVVGVGYRPQSSSFTSSHAANHFGIAVFCFFTLRHIWGNRLYLLLLWAASICFTQVYVGVHYPVDVFCGSIIGAVTGTLTAYLFYRLEGPLHMLTRKSFPKPI